MFAKVLLPCIRSSRVLCVHRFLPTTSTSAVQSTSLVQYRRLAQDSQSHSKSDGTNGKSDGQSRADKTKIRRAYAVGGCLMFMWLSTHGIILYRRRSEFRALNEKLPPISFEQFSEEYLSKGQVKAIVYHPQFAVGNVYLHSATEQMMKKTVVDMFHIAPDRFSRPPDVRFYFEEGDEKEVEKAVFLAQKGQKESGKEVKAVEFTVDQFPSYRELSFIIASTFFTLAAFTLMK